MELVQSCPKSSIYILYHISYYMYVHNRWHTQPYKKKHQRSVSLGFFLASHYNDVIMSVMASQMTSLMIVYSTIYSNADQRKHQSSAPLTFVRGIHWWLVNFPHKGPVTQKMFPFDDIMGIHQSLMHSLHKGPVMQKTCQCHHVLMWYILV